ncbi:MAG: 1-(5-phosphoribosyl)-5-[(5-phosphoribosylamino)methylideneamino]imidazole-4-carboxamide isomerase [Chlorobia bacterium]|nr:1-(5-phosphoribosyl)-5-[(5-phosphoribosylamino)methylideneamino]imidazole-4-carboxamide isomerase [Fimbriimonadaceae bacterium]
MLILPAIDIRGGKCVRLRQGDYAQETIYSEDPVAVARGFVEQGAEWIHIVDLDGAKAGQPVNLDIVEQIVKATSAKVELGGGIRNLETATQVLNRGIARVILGSRLVSNRAESADLFHALGDQAVAGIDARNGMVSVVGWTEDSELGSLDLARELEEAGARRFIVTDIATDGMLSGPNLAMLAEFSGALTGHVIASGGVSSLEDLKSINAIQPPIEGAIVGKAIYEGRLTVQQAIEAVS